MNLSKSLINQLLIGSIYELSYLIRGLQAKGTCSQIPLLGLILHPTVGFHKEVRNSFLIAKIILACNRDFLLKLLELSYKL